MKNRDGDGNFKLNSEFRMRNYGARFARDLDLLEVGRLLNYNLRMLISSSSKLKSLRIPAKCTTEFRVQNPKVTSKNLV